MVTSSLGKASKQKHKHQGGLLEKSRLMAHFSKKSTNNQHAKGKHPFKRKNMVKIKCFNYNAKRHFVRDCLELKKVFSYIKISELCVTSLVFLIDPYPLWIINSRATNHVGPM